MLRLIVSIGIFLYPLYSSGQLYTMSDHYVHESLAINPAYAGSKDALSTTIICRNSWVGFEGSPKTMSFAIHTPLNNEKIGLGLLIMNDKIGVSEATNFIGNYAYRLDLGFGKLAFGLAFGMTIINTAWNKLAAADANDEQLASNYSSGAMPNFSTGIYYSTKKYFIGLSLPLFLSHEYNPQKGKYLTRNNFAEYNYFCNTGYLLNIGSDIRFFPSLLLKYHKGNAPQVDINSQIILRNKVWLGASYRTKNSMAGIIQYQINNQFRVAYSYDFIIGGNALYKNNSHEIMLIYVFNYKAEVAGPRQF